MKSIILGASKGIGKSIHKNLSEIPFISEIIATSSADIDTSNLDSVKQFVENQAYTDILVLNTGGPPAKSFYDITEDEWLKYFNQLFYSFVYILQNLRINEGGFVFLISSHQIKEPEEKMALSVSFRLAFSSILKILSHSYAKKNISCINIAPGPIGTQRLKSLVSDIKEFEKSLPMGRSGDPNEIGLFVRSIVENNIKYLTGSTINFDGGKSSFIF